MRASVFVGTSLDGFLARPNGALDFLDAGGKEPHGYEEFMASVDAIVIGRNTFDVVLGFGTWPYQKPVFVLSTRALPPVPAGARVEQLSGDPRDIVSRLEARGRSRRWAAARVIRFEVFRVRAAWSHRRSTTSHRVACSPVSEAVASSQVSAIQRRRVMVIFSRKRCGMPRKH